MQITNKQLEELDKNKLENFIGQSIIFLQLNFKEWCNGKTAELIRQFIVSMIAFGNTYNIKKGNNLQKLMHYKIEYQFDIPLHEKLEKILTNPGWNENARIENLYLILSSGRYKLTEMFADKDVQKQ